MTVAKATRKNVWKISKPCCEYWSNNLAPKVERAMLDHELALIGSFIIPLKQERWRELVLRKKGRSKITASLYHLTDIDPQFAQQIPTSLANPASLLSELKRLGAGDTCWVWSTNQLLDSRENNLLDVLTALMGSEDGALLSIKPGKLGYYNPETDRRGYILRRT